MHNAPTDRFARENGTGIGADCTPESFAQSVRELFADPERYARYRANARSALLEGNMWIHRARQVVRELGEKRR